MFPCLSWLKMASGISSSKDRFCAEIRVSHVWLFSGKPHLDDNARDHITIHLGTETKQIKRNSLFSKNRGSSRGTSLPLQQKSLENEVASRGLRESSLDSRLYPRSGQAFNLSCVANEYSVDLQTREHPVETVDLLLRGTEDKECS